VPVPYTVRKVYTKT